MRYLGPYIRDKATGKFFFHRAQNGEPWFTDKLAPAKDFGSMSSARISARKIVQQGYDVDIVTIKMSELEEGYVVHKVSPV